jgi:hypothetical protein
MMAASTLGIISVGSVNMFGSNTEADHASGDAPEDREMFQQGQREWEALEWCFRSQSGANEPLVGENLKILSHASGKFAALLDSLQAVVDLLTAR